MFKQVFFSLVFAKSFLCAADLPSNFGMLSENCNPKSSESLFNCADKTDVCCEPPLNTFSAFGNFSSSQEYHSLNAANGFSEPSSLWYTGEENGTSTSVFDSHYLACDNLEYTAFLRPFEDGDDAAVVEQQYAILGEDVFLPHDSFTYDCDDEFSNSSLSPSLENDCLRFKSGLKQLDSGKETPSKQQKIFMDAYSKTIHQFEKFKTDNKSFLLKFCTENDTPREIFQGMEESLDSLDDPEWFPYKKRTRSHKKKIVTHPFMSEDKDYSSSFSKNAKVKSSLRRKRCKTEKVVNRVPVGFYKNNSAFISKKLKEGLSKAEIADLLGLDYTSGLHSYLHRAKSKTRK